MKMAFAIVILMLSCFEALACSNPKSITANSNPVPNNPNAFDYSVELGTAVVAAFGDANTVNGGEYCVKYVDGTVAIVVLTKTRSLVSATEKPGTRVVPQIGPVGFDTGSCYTTPSFSYTTWWVTIWYEADTGNVVDVQQTPIENTIPGQTVCWV